MSLSTVTIYKTNSLKANATIKHQYKQLTINSHNVIIYFLWSFRFSMYTHLMMAQDSPESFKEPINYERSISKFRSDILTSIRQIERIKKMCRRKMSILFNQIYIYIYIYIYLFTNLLSTSIHGYQEKRKNIIGQKKKNHRPGKKRKNIIGQKKKRSKGQPRHTSWKRSRDMQSVGQK